MALNPGSLSSQNPGTVRKQTNHAAGQYSAVGSAGTQTIKATAAIIRTIVVSGTAADATVAFADAGGTFLHVNLAAAGTIVIPWNGVAHGSFTVVCAATTTISVSYD